MFRLTDKRGYDYYITEANLPEYYRSYDNKTAGLVNFIAAEAARGAWIKCFRGKSSRDTVVVLASEIYIIEEVKR